MDYQLLSAQDKLSYDIFFHDREVAIGLSEYPSELLPISQLFSDQTLFAVLGSGDSVQPFNTVIFRQFYWRMKTGPTWIVLSNDAPGHQ